MTWLNILWMDNNMEFILIILYIIVILIGLSFKKSKFILALTLTYMFFILAFDSNSPDYESYRRIYNNVDLYTAEELYVESSFWNLCRLMNAMGVSYENFRITWAVFYIVFLRIAVKRLTPYPSYVLALFLIWPFVPFVSSMRFSMASILSILGITYLVSSSKYSTYWFLCFIYFASCIHSSCVVFLLYSLIKIPKRFFYVITIGIPTVIYILFKVDILASLVYSVYPTQRVFRWLTTNRYDDVGSAGFLGLLVYIGYVVYFAIFAHYAAKYSINHIEMSENVLGSKYNSLNMSIKRKIMNLDRVITCNIMLVPFLIMSLEFNRYIYGNLIINYAMLSYFMYTVKDKKYIKLSKILERIFIASIILYGMLYQYSYSSHDVLSSITKVIIVN